MEKGIISMSRVKRRKTINHKEAPGLDKNRKRRLERLGG
jgi:hypothetical protein